MSHFKSEYCHFSVESEKKSHYHMLIQVDSEEQLNQLFPSQKRFSIPCIFTCFKYLVSTAKDVKGNVELFDKLKLALTYSAQPDAANLDLLDLTATKKSLPILLLSAKTSNNQTSPNQRDCKKAPAEGDKNELMIQLRLLHHQRQNIRKTFDCSFKETQREQTCSNR